MKRNIMLVLLLGLFIARGIAGTSAESYILGGCDHKIAGSNGYGSDTSGEISAALFVPAAKLRTLAGNKISRVDVGLISRINVRDVTVWVRKQLDGDNLASSSIERGSLGWNEVTFSNPYVIEQDCPGLYVGFTYANSGSSHPVSFVGRSDEYTSWFRGKAGDDWEEMTTKGVLSLEVVVTGDNLPQYDLSLLSCNVAPDPLSGENVYKVNGRVANEGLKTVDGFSLRVSCGEAVGPECEVELEVAPGEKGDFSVSYPAGMSLTGDVAVTVTRLNVGEDADMADNTISTRVAFLRNVLFEEFTTEQCVNCPGAAEMVHDVMTRHNDYDGRVVSVCHHSAFGTDKFTRECDTELLWMFDLNGQAFAPAAMFDRRSIFKRGLNMDRIEPIVALRSEKDIEECIAECMEIPPHAMVVVKVLSSDAASATVEVKVITDDEFNISSPVLTFYTMEDNVNAIQQAGAQGAYIHRHVIRDDNGAWGEPIEIENNAFSKTFTVDLDPEWKRGDLGFVAFIAERDSDNIGNNAVENAAYAPLTTDFQEESEILIPDTSIPYPTAIYDINGKRVSESTEGILIMIMSDGSTKKIVNLSTYHK